MSRRTPAEQAAFEAHLFERHPREELASWAPTLRVFRYCRAIGGLAGGDADELVAAFAVPTRADLERVAGALGLPLRAVPADAPRAEPGRSYTAEAWAALPRPIPGHEDLEQPGHVRVDGRPAFAWVHPGRLELSVVDPDAPYDVTAASIAAARALEASLAPLSGDVLDPPRPGEHCVSPATQPGLWH